MTARELITDVLTDIKVLGAGENLQPEDAVFCLRSLNQWIDGLALDRRTKFFRVRTTKALASGTDTYTIGTGGDINIVRPTEIDHDGARLIIDSSADPTTEIPVHVFTDQEWQAIAQKELESPLVRGLRYDRNWSAGLARIYLWPIPNAGGTSLVLYTDQALAQFANLTTDYTFPPGYERFFRTNFRAEIAGAGSYNKTLTREQSQQAIEARRLVKRANDRPVAAGMDAALLKNEHTFNYRTGEFR